MAPNTMSFDTALITGGGGGIGKAMAKYFIDQGKKVIIVGRTVKNLQSSAKELGHGITYYALEEHPNLDCLVNNAGVQRPLSSTSFDLQKADQEINISIQDDGPMNLITHFLPHFKSKPHATIIDVSSILGFLPTSVINPVYNGTKAWLHFFTMNLRQQLGESDDGGENIKVVEIAPPTVSTDLHREREDPDDNKKEKNKNALSVDEFMEDVSKGLQGDKETIGAGMSEKVVES
ncbi:NAD(P)-binding protein [Acephala macrosclerotiorum]|nr:NAD(P)-binding protein [Acephala macrosclerotiorum]